MMEPEMEPSLPKLLALDKRNNDFDDRVREAATIAGIRLEPESQDDERPSTPSRTRSEFVLRWALEKFKTPESRKACRTSDLLWPLLDQLMLIVPASSVARLLQVNSFVKNVGSLLDECAKASHPEVAKPTDGALKLQPNGVKSSKKRKRGDKEPSPPAEETVLLSPERLVHTTLGITSVLRSIIALATSRERSADAASQAHLISATKINAEDAAFLLGAWLRCLPTLLENSSSSRNHGAHKAVLHIWDARSREHSDETGASAQAFSKHCLVPIVRLLSNRSARSLSNGREGPRLVTSFERLLAKHVFVPAHTSFDNQQASRNPDLQKSRAALLEYLEPLKGATAEQGTTDEPSARPLRDTLPDLLDLAIRLSPHSTPTQQIAHVPWLESVFDALAACALERPKQITSDAGPSPLTAMLQVLKSRDINLSSEFLESILMKSSGLKGLQKGNSPLQLDVVAALLDLKGGIFLQETIANKRALPIAQAGQPPYVEALIASLSEIALVSSIDDGTARQTNGISQPTYEATFVVQSILIPLLRAHTASRKLPSFISLWFWEVRRKWKSMGTADETTQSPWLSLGLVRALRDVLEDSLSSTRVGDLLVEFILPIRQLLDEASRAGANSPDWPSIPAAAPACAALVVLDALLHCVEREETLRENQAAWLALKDIPMKLALMDLTGFPAASRVWSIVTRVHKLSYFVDGKKAFMTQQKAFLEGGELFKKASTLAQTTSGGPAEDGLKSAALDFVWTVCGIDLDSELNFAAQDTLQPTLTAQLNSKTQLIRVVQLCVEYPAVLRLQLRRPRLEFLRALHNHIADADVTEAVHGLIPLLLDGPPHVLEQMLFVFAEDVVKADAVSKAEAASLEILLKIPPQAISREMREKILDGMNLLRGQYTFEDDILDLIEMRIALMGRMLAGGSCGSAELCTVASRVVELADVLDSRLKQAQAAGEHDRALRLAKSADDLFSAIMHQAIFNDKEERRQTFLATFTDLALTKLEDLISEGKPKKMGLPSPATVLLVKCFLVTAIDSRSDSNVDMSSLRKRLHKLLWSTATHNDLCPARSWVRLRVISELLGSGASNGKETELGEQALAQQQSKDQINAVSAIDIDSALHPSINTLDFAARLSDVTSAQDCCKILDVYDKRMKSARVHAKMDAVAVLLEKATAQHLQMLGVLLKQLEPDEVSEQESAKRILLQLCEVSLKSWQIEQFGAAMSCITTIILKKTFLVTQHGIDTLLNTLTTLSSPQAPSLPTEHAEFIYTRICQLVTSVILLHRRRLGGRMHLLVALLQNLMTCLFTPNRYQTSSTRPTWISNSMTFGVEAAIAYTRVITTLCEPTVSSTKGYYSSSSLVDENKKAKEYAGQYVSYLLLHYCSLQLQVGGGLGPGLGEKLRQAMWVIMSVVDLDAMRGMNAGMGKGERVIWGSLWGEWQRVGKFKLR